MCDSCSFATQAEFSTSTYRKARRVHVCDECGGKVQPKERYQRTIGVHEGTLFVTELCLRCARLWDCHSAAVQAIEEDCYPEIGLLRESIGECARERREYVEAFRVAWKGAA